jgi:hypothetical protein
MSDMLRYYAYQAGYEAAICRFASVARYAIENIGRGGKI